MRALLTCALLTLVFAGCTPIQRGSSILPTGSAYQGHAVELFDDAIEPRSVGLSLDENVPPKSNPRFRERAQTADTIARVRVGTVTGKTDGPDSSYTIGFQVVEKLGGNKPASDDFNVRVDASSPAYGIVKSFEGRLVGKTMVLFARGFAREGDETVVHFHASPDDAEVKAAVKEAVILDELK